MRQAACIAELRRRPFKSGGGVPCRMLRDRPASGAGRTMIFKAGLMALGTTLSSDS